MPLRSPVLLVPPDWPIAHRWRLVSTLYAQRGSLVEGTLATALVVVTCLVRTHWAGFCALLAACVAVLAARLVQAHAFRRAVCPPQDSRATTPEYWALHFTIGAALAVLVWGATDLAVMTRTNDPVTQLFVFMVQSGWLAGTCVRNAASPFAVLAQVTISLLCTIVSILLSPPGFMWIVGPLACISGRAAMTVGRQFGEEVLHAIQSERQLEAANARLTELSSTDGLTGIGNRRAFDEKLRIEWARAAREVTDLGLLLIDVDHFKLYNDRYGHPAGDACLRAVATAVAATLRRPPDFAGRFGGEEFVALLPGTGTQGGREVAERVRLAVESLALPHEDSLGKTVTISIGVASLAPCPGDEANTLIELADRALYDAKQGGRNRVRIAQADLRAPSPEIPSKAVLQGHGAA